MLEALDHSPVAHVVSAVDERYASCMIGGPKAWGPPTGSWSVANAQRMPLALAIDNPRRIVGATELAVTIDLESGYGDAPEVVGETIAGIRVAPVGMTIHFEIDDYSQQLPFCNKIVIPTGA